MSTKARELAELSRTIIDTSDATAITINANEEVTLADDLFLADGKKAIFGAGSDFQIFHDGNNSFMNNTSGDAGALSIKSHDINLMSSTSETMATFVEDGAASLYHNNGVRLATTASGVDISGTLSATGVLTVIDGSTSAPSISNAGDSNTGIYFPADDQLGLLVGGSRKLHVTSSGVAIQNGDLTVSSTISSGAITSSGSISTSSGSVSATGAIGNLVSGSQGQQMERGDDSVTTLRFDANRWRLYAGVNASEMISAYENGNVDFTTGNLMKGGVTFMDNSRNITAGTISSGTITSTGNIVGAGINSTANYTEIGSTSASNLIFRRNNASYIQADQSGGYFIFITNGRSTSYANRALAITTDNHLRAAGFVDAVSGFQVGGTTVIDSSRNLTNIGTISAGQIQATNNSGSNGTTTAEYAVIGIATGNSQATIGAHHNGDGYANLNLSSVVSGDRKMWHISKRISSSSTQNRLEFFWYESGGFNSRFQFETDGAFLAVDRITSNKGVHATSVNNADDGVVVKAGSGDTAASRGRFSNNAADVAIGRNIATFPGTWTKADNSVASAGWVFGTSGAAAFYQSNAGDTTPLANQRFRIMDGPNNGTVIIGSSTTTHSYDATKLSLSGAGNIVAAYNLASTNEFWILNNLANIASGVVCKVDFRVLNSSKGYIGITSTGVQYNQGSDYRLKDELNYDFDATSLVKKIKPVQFKWLADMDAGIDTGFIAHELQEVHPFAVSGEKDAVREDGEIAPQGVDASKLVGLLTKALQEALSRIDSLEGKVKALQEAA